MNKILKRVLFYGAAFYLVVCATLFFVQWHALYPATSDVSSLEEAKQSIPNIQEYKINISDDNSDAGSNVRAFYASGKNGKVIVFYYGNKQTMKDPISEAVAYHKKGYGVLTCSYPGYDGNPGFTKASSLYRAGTACVDFLNHEMKIPDEKIIIHGLSLGGHVAVHVAQNRKFDAVILLAPLGSALDIARKKYPLLPVKLIMVDHLISYEKAKRIIAPLFVVHNIYDKVVPYEQGLKIYNNAPSSKQMRTIDHLLPNSNGHGDIYDYGIKPVIMEWLADKKAILLIQTADSL
jgi:esterase/lipase